MRNPTLAEIAQPDRPRNVITLNRRDRVKLEVYWPPRNDAPLWSVRVPGEWMRPDELRWLGSAIEQALAEYDALRDKRED